MREYAAAYLRALIYEFVDIYFFVYIFSVNSCLFSGPALRSSQFCQGFGGIPVGVEELRDIYPFERHSESAIREGQHFGGRE